MDEATLFEAALAEDPAALRTLAESLAADPGQRERWIAHARLICAIRGRSPRPDLAARVFAVSAARRPSQGRATALRVRRRISPSRWPWALAALLLLGLTFGGVWMGRQEAVPTGPVWTVGQAEVVERDGRIEVGAGVLDLTWPDGTRCRLGPGSAAEPGAVAWLTQGRVQCDVAPHAGTPFRIRAGDSTIEVHGTRFTVDVSPEATQVAVEEGTVQVSHRGSTRELGAGSVLRAQAAGFAQAHGVWAWASGEPLRYGTWDAASFWIRSQPYPGDEHGFACIAAPVDLTWDTRAMVRARLHTPMEARINLQVGIAGAWNMASRRSVAAGWSTLEWNLEILRPYKPQRDLPAGSRIDSLLLESNLTEPFQVAWFEMIRPTP